MENACLHIIIWSGVFAFRGKNRGFLRKISKSRKIYVSIVSNTEMSLFHNLIYYSSKNAVHIYGELMGTYNNMERATVDFTEQKLPVQLQQGNE